VDIIPAAPEYLINLIEAIADQVARMLVYPFDQIGELGKRSRHKKSMCKFGIGKTVVIFADQSVQIGGTTAWIGYDKDRLLDLDLPVARKEYLIYQPENKMNELIERILKYEKKG
jgi:hypothetical protein